MPNINAMAERLTEAALTEKDSLASPLSFILCIMLTLHSIFFFFSFFFHCSMTHYTAQTNSKCIVGVFLFAFIFKLLIFILFLTGHSYKHIMCPKFYLIFILCYLTFIHCISFELIVFVYRF